MPINQQLFDRLAEVLVLNGIPENNRDTADLIYSITGQDVYRHLTDDMVRFENTQSVLDAHKEHRASHRIAAFNEQVFNEHEYIYIGRSSNTQGSRVWPMVYDWAAYVSRYMRDMPLMGNMPFIVSEQAKFDRNPMNNDMPEQHATLQLLHLPSMVEVDRVDMALGTLRSLKESRLPERYWSDLGATYFDIEKYDTIITDTVTDLEAEGWTLVKREYTYRSPEGEMSDVELVIGAIAPENVGRHAVQLFNVNNCIYNATATLDVLDELFSTLPEVSVEEPSDDSLTAISLIQQARAAVAGIRRNINTLRHAVRNRQTELDGLLTSVANNNRLLNDERRQLNEMEVGIERVAMQSVMDVARIPEMIAGFRQVNTATISTEGESMWLEIITHPFGMRVPPGRYRTEDGAVREEGSSSLYVVPAKLRINLMNSSWSRAIQVEPANGGGRWHPHVSGENTPCWGRAATPMAEAWGRRDWESFVRFLLGWMTQYDANDIYTYIHTIMDRRGMAPRTGWLLPDEDGNVPQPVMELPELEEEDTDEFEELEVRFIPLEA